MASSKLFLLVSFLLLLRAYAEFHVCNDNPLQYCNQSLPYVVRVKILVDMMTLEEKVAQLNNAAAGVPRLSIPFYQWWSEGLHGVSNTGPGVWFGGDFPAATSFPMPILTSAAFNQTLWRSIGEIVSTEARAMHNAGMAGLTYWSPTVNLAREPRWGRIGETAGEDPFVIGTYATEFVRGMQDIKGKERTEDLNSRPLKVSVTCKHYTAYDTEVDRTTYNSEVSEQDLIETYSRPFEMCVRDGGASGLMCGYNRINGFPACADRRLLEDTVRGDWNLHGYIVSDCNSVQVLEQGHQWLRSLPEDAVHHVLRAGMDLNCGDYYSRLLIPAIQQGKVREEDVDEALRHLYQVLMRVGFFDGSPEFDSLGRQDVCRPEHIERAAEAARQGIVLLKNKDNMLPLSSTVHRKILVVGPHGQSEWHLLGTYAGNPCRFVNIVNGLKKYTWDVTYEPGCENVICDRDRFIFPAMKAARQADATIIAVGNDASTEGDGHDRKDLFFYGYQTQLINQVAAASKGPVVVVIIGAGPVDVTFALDNSKISAILWAGYPGPEGGQAIADVIYGSYNPGGRLPMTWYKSDYINQLPLKKLQLRPDEESGYPGRTYKFYNRPTVFPFGYGLSYTRFSYRLVSAVHLVTKKLGQLQHCQRMEYKPDTIFTPACHSVRVEDLDCNDNIDLQVEVKNEGERDGSDVVLVYSIPPPEYMGTPKKQLVAFQRVLVAAHATATAKLSINACKALNLVTKTAYTVLPSGLHTIAIGDGKNRITFPVRVDFEFGQK